MPAPEHTGAAGKHSIDPGFFQHQNESGRTRHEVPTTPPETTAMRTFLRILLVAVSAWLPFGGAHAQEMISNVPRNQTLIVENPEGTIKNAGWFNIWAINAGGQSTGLHQLAMDTFWYIDPNRGVDGVWDNSLASDKPIYNKDFTEMTVKLRKGLYWSDGVEFSAADVVYTVETHLNTKGLRWSAPIQINVASVSAPDPYTVVYKLKKPNSRFHALYTVRWNAMWIMPKHVFEKAGDPLKFAFNPPVTLGAYTLNSFDPKASGSSGSAARTGSAPRSRASASPGRSTSRMSMPARPTSA
jgi:peptide/nickel transport system substrate-binding protein